MSLVSASCENIPKQNVEVVDQNMNLLSEGLYDENGKEQATNSSGLYIARKSRKRIKFRFRKSYIFSTWVYVWAQVKL